MAGRKGLGAELARECQEIAELDPRVAIDAGDRRLAREIARGEGIHHLAPKAALVVEHVIRDGETLGDTAGIVDVLARTAGAFAPRRGPVVVKLERYADHVVALGLEEGSHGRAVDPARHGDDDSRLGRRLGYAKRIDHGRDYKHLRRQCNRHYSAGRPWRRSVAQEGIAGR